MEDSLRYLRLADSLFNAYSAKRLEWQRVAKHVCPDLLIRSDLNENRGSSRDGDQICPQAADCARKLAGAHMNYITPIGHKWFRYSLWDPDRKKEEANNEIWFAAASDISQIELERSNFYSQLLACYYDRVVTGTALMMCEWDEFTEILVFNHVPAGTYALAEDSKHNINTVARKFKLTPSQLYEMFPDAEFSKPVIAAYEDEARRYSAEFEILHIVMPRAEADKSMEAVDSLTFPFASIYIDVENKKILSEGGYKEFPYMATRFERYGNQVYGTSPLVMLENLIRNLRIIDKSIVTTAQRKAIPPVLIPPDMVGQVDLSAGGQTVMPLQYLDSNVPREWASSGDSRELLAHKDAFEKQLKDAMYVSLLEIISSVERGMTATEVNARESEKIMSYALTFTQFICDFRPMMVRIFSLLLRAGKFPHENEPVWLFRNNGKDTFLLEPKVSYIGRMAQAMERAQLNGAESSLAWLIQMAQATQNPELLMFIDMEKLARKQAIGYGMPASCMLSASEVEKLKADLQEAQNNKMQAEQAAAMAEANERNANAAATLSALQ